jgi:hypothetical protein
LLLDRIEDFGYSLSIILTMHDHTEQIVEDILLF